MEHLTFKNIPIDGNINEFTASMEKCGFTKQTESDNLCVMTGKFANREVQMYIPCSPKTKIAYRLSLYASEQNSWIEIKSDYEKLRSQFSSKYGNPTDEFSFFMEPYYEGDGYELQALENKKAIFSSYWTMPKGTISVNISEYRQINFSYDDAINTAIAENERNELILDEI